MNYWKRYPGDYSRDTGHLSLAEHGAYALLLDTYYATEAPLPANMTALHRLCRAMTAEERAAVESVADQFFKPGSDGRRHNDRADKQIAKDREFLDSQAEKSRRAVEARQAKTPGTTPGQAPGTTPGTTPGSTPGSTPRFTPPTPTPTPSPTPTPQPKSSDAVLRKRKNAVAAVPSREVWTAYSGAYLTRYGTEPVRNAKVNAMLAQVVARIGADEAPHVAAWYVTSNRALYVSAKHCADLLVRDCEGLRTEWATGRSVTDTAARQADSKQTNLNVAETLIAELRNQA